MSGFDELSGRDRLLFLGRGVSHLLFLLFLRICHWGLGLGLGRAGACRRLAALVGLLRHSAVRLRRLARERHLVELVHIFAIDEIDRVRVDDSRMITLALNLEIVGYEADGATRIGCMRRLERRAAEAAAASTTASAAAVVATATTATVGTIALTATAAALIAAIAVVALTVLMATATALPVAATTSLVAAASLAAVHHMLLLIAASHVLLLPGLLAVAWLEVTFAVVATASHLLLLGAALPMRSVLIVSGITGLLVIV